MIVRWFCCHSTGHKISRSCGQDICPERHDCWRYNASAASSGCSREPLCLIPADLELGTEFLGRGHERTHGGVVWRVLESLETSRPRVWRQVRVQEYLQFSIFCRVPPAQCLHLLGGRAWGEIAALNGEKTRILHRRTVRGFHVALCQLR